MRFDLSTRSPKTGSLEVVDIRTLMTTRERAQALHLLGLLREGLMAQASPEGDFLPDTDEMTEALDRAPGGRRGSGPSMALIVAGYGLMGEAPDIRAYASGEFYPRSRCALITGIGRATHLTSEDLWIGFETITEHVRDRLVERLASLAGPRGPEGFFFECEDPDAEGIDTRDDTGLEPRRRRSRRTETRRRFDLSVLPFEFSLPAWAPERTALLSCATRGYDHLRDPSRIAEFLDELWEWVAGRLPVFAPRSA